MATSAEREAANAVRLDAGDVRMDAFQLELEANTRLTRAIDAKFGRLLEWMEAWEGAIKVLDGLGKIAKPVGIVAGAFTAIGAAWLAIKHGLGLK